MASRKEELRIALTAQDSASKTIDEVAGKAESLASTKSVIELEAEDNATEVVEEVGENVETLDGETATAELEADDLATEVVEEVADAVETLDGETATAELDAEDLASEVIDGVSVELSALDGESADTTIDATDNATEAIDTVTSDLDTLDGSTATVTIEADGDAEGTVGDIGGGLEDIVGGAAGPGLAALSVTALLEVGRAAADAVLDVEGVARTTGATLDEISRLKEVWEFAGGDINSLERMMIRVNDRLRESPELANALGIEIGENDTAFDTFTGAVRALNDGQLTANQRLELAMELFGSKGVLILNDLDTRVGNLDEGMAAVGDNEIITQEDVDNAHQLLQSMDAFEDAMGEVARQILPTVASQAERVAQLLDSWPIQKLIGGFEVMGAQVSLIEAALGADGGSVADTLADAGDALETLLGLGREEITFPLIEAWRELKADLADNGEVDTATDALGLLADASGKSEDEIVALAGGIDTAASAAGAAVEPLSEHEQATRDIAEATDDFYEALQDEADGLEDVVAGLEEQIELLDELNEATRDAADLAIELEEATEDVTSARDKYAEAQKPDSEEDLGEATDDLRDSIIDLVSAQEAKKDADAAAAGVSRTRVQQIDSENAGYLAQASTLNGPARTAVLQHILRLNGIPEQRITEILAGTDAEDLALANAELNNVSRTREAAVQADAKQSSIDAANRRLDLLARTINARVRVNLPALPRISYSNGSPTYDYTGGTGPIAVAKGAQTMPAGWALVGEQGPELVNMAGGESVTNAGRTAELLRGGGPSQVTNNYTTVNVPAGTTARDWAKAQRRRERTQGPS